MSYSEQWNIQNVDADALKKITEIAEAQGTNAHDFLNNLIKNNPATPKETIKEINEAFRTPTLKRNNVPEPTTSKDISQNLSNELKTYSANVEKELRKNTPRLPVSNTVIEKQNTIPKKTQSTKPKETRPKNARTAKRTVKKESSVVKQTSNNLFETLTKKIGIDNTVISQLSSADITDTIMRERQLRDFMRVQMTEMRDIMGAMFEKKVDDKLQQFTHLIELLGNSTTQNGNFGSDIEFNDLLKTDDFNFKLAILADNLQSKILESVNSEFSETINVLYNNNKEQSDNIIDNITKLYDLIIDNLGQQLEAIINQSINGISSQLLHNSPSMDNSSIHILQDQTQNLSLRLENIENLCIALDNKLTQMHLDHVQQSQNSDNQTSPNSDIVKSEFIAITQTLKDYMKEIVDSNNTNQEKNNNNIVNTLKSMSDRLSNLEEGGLETPKPTRYLDNDDHTMPTSYHSYDLESHDEVLNATTNILDSGWDDNDTQNLSSHNNNTDSKYNNNISDDSIRNLDRKSFSKDALLKSQNTKEQSGSSIKNLFKKLM